MIAAVIAAAAALFFPAAAEGRGGERPRLHRFPNGQVLDTVDIAVGMTDQERTYGEYVVEFSHGNIRVKSAPCANQDCVRTGWISRGGQSIVCLPGRFVVELAAESGENDDFDIVVK